LVLQESELISIFYTAVEFKGFLGKADKCCMYLHGNVRQKAN